jgi:hypothetical protein
VSEKEKDLADDADRADAPRADADDNEDAPAGSKASADDGGEDAPDDGASARVADALGVGDGEGDEAAAGEGDPEAEAKAEDAGPANRAARRRDEALERRRKRKGTPGASDALPKDKNKRAKELLLRRKEAAVEERPAQLEAGEMVDDALSRMWASTTKWLRANLTTIQWVILAGAVGAGGYVGYTYFTQKTLGAASGLLASAAMAEDAYILPEDKRPDEDKELDPTPLFKTIEERNDKVLATYKEVSEKHAGSGAAILAKLGEAGVLLDKRDFDKAIEAFEAVLKTPLAAADLDVKGRSIEGIGLAKEGKGDADGAMASFKQLEGVDARGFKELAQYHQARMLLAKNNEADRAKAKDLLKTAYDKIKAPSKDAKPFPYLEKSLEQALKLIDPTLVPDKDTLNSVRGGQMSPEEIQARLRKMQEELGKKTGDGDGH